MRQSITVLLGLENVLVGRIERSEKGVIVPVSSPRTCAHCRLCGQRTNREHDRRTRLIRHTTVGNEQVLLALTTRRFLCAKHGPFSEPYPSGISRKRTTQRLDNEALAQLSHSSFDHTSQRFGVSFHTLLDRAAARKASLPWPEKGDIKLAIDEHSFSGRDLKITVGDISRGVLRDILKDDRQDTLRRYFRTIPAEVQSRISEVCIDMKHSYLAAIRDELPRSLVVVDRFHVIRMANDALDDIRRILQPGAEKGKRRINRFLLLKAKENLTSEERAELDDVFIAYHRFPALKAAWITKESLREMYVCTSKREAEKVYDRILLIMQDEELGTLAALRRTLLKWRPYILNFFVSRTTNAFIEGCHNRIKLIKRTSYGFRNFTNYMLKVTLAFMPFLFLGTPH